MPGQNGCCAPHSCAGTARDPGTPFLCRARGPGLPLATTPSMASVPESMAASPAIARSVVVLPHPEGPSKHTNSPGAMSRLTPCTAGTLPYGDDHVGQANGAFGRHARPPVAARDAFDAEHTLDDEDADDADSDHQGRDGGDGGIALGPDIGIDLDREACPRPVTRKAVTVKLSKETMKLKMSADTTPERMTGSVDLQEAGARDPRRGHEPLLRSTG